MTGNDPRAPYLGPLGQPGYGQGAPPQPAPGAYPQPDPHSPRAAQPSAAYAPGAFPGQLPAQYPGTPARYPGQTASYPGQYPPHYPMQPQGPFQYPSANPYQPLGPQNPYGGYPASRPTTWRRIAGLVLIVVGSMSIIGILQAVLRLMSDGGGFALERLIGSILFSALFMVPGLVLMNSKK